MIRAGAARPLLAVEVGGTSLRAARVDAEGGLCQPLLTADTPNHLRGGHADVQAVVLAAIGELSRRALDGAVPAAVAIAYPGPIDGRGRVLATPTVLGPPDGRPFPLAEACRPLWPGATVRVMNDVTAAGYRYVADGFRDFAIVTIGSGVGHKLFLDGLPRVGEGRGGEIGHLRLDWSAQAPLCECGGRGHLGGLASGRAVISELRSRAQRDPSALAGSRLAAVGAEGIDGPAVAAAFLESDAFASAAVSDAAHYLGQALAAVHLDSGVERIILVGGFAAALGERFRRLIAEASAAACWNVGQDWDAMIVLGEPEAGLRGAALCAAAVV